MLAQLSVQNFAVIKNIAIEFDEGLNALTGETGAGKSVLIDALALALGYKASREAVRTGCEKTVVQAVFFIDENHPSRMLAQEAGISVEEQLIFTREVTAAGRSICRINATLVTASLLRQLGAKLVDIHGQHEHQSLLDKSRHIAFFDQYSPETIRQAKAVKEAYEVYLAEKKKLEALLVDRAEAEQKKAMLSADIAAIESLSPQIGEDAEIERKISRIKNRAQFAKSLHEAYESLYADERSALAGLASATEALEALSGMDESFAESVHALLRANAEMEEVAHSLKKHLAEDEADEEADIDALESRAYALTQLKRKYGVTIEEVLQVKEEKRRRLAEIENLDEGLHRQQEALTIAKEAYFEKAKALTRLRLGQKAKFEKKITEVLKELAMPDARFEAAITAKKGEAAISATGQEELEFLFSANKGIAPKALTKIASGGEVSRLMLAMKIAVTDSEIQTLVFDEIDTGISGITAQKMAEKLKELSASYQVLLVTHLPQIAAMAQAHYSAVKSSDDMVTSTQILQLNREGKEKEIAKMIGGERLSASALAHARQMLDAAKNSDTGQGT